MSRNKKLNVENYNKNPKFCKGCGCKLEYDKRNLVFCNRVCYTKYNFTDNRNDLIKWAKMGGETAKKRGEDKEKLYYTSPKKCKQCGETIVYSRRKCDFCNSSCSARFNNLHYRKNPNRYLQKCEYCGENIIRKRKLKLGEQTFCCHEHKWLYYTEEKLKLGQPIKGSTLRYYLLHTREHKCEKCGLTRWCERPIPLDVHHIDGDSKNNDSKNLQLLCKNCHGITDNYGAKNIGVGTRNLYYIKKSDRDKRNKCVNNVGG